MAAPYGGGSSQAAGWTVVYIDTAHFAGWSPATTHRAGSTRRSGRLAGTAAPAPAPALGTAARWETGRFSSR
jgi:hypothetical protein